MNASPEAIFDAANAFQKTYALKAAVDCDLFTAIGEGHSTAAAMAKARNIPEKGARVVCDFLTTLGFLTKDGDVYSLAPDAAAFLDRRSPSYIGSALTFLAAPHIVDMVSHTSETVREGTIADAGTMAPEHDVWPVFAEAMGNFVALPAALTSEMAGIDPNDDTKVLDIAAGHGEFGFAMARRFPRAQIVAVDWAPVLAVARKRAEVRALNDRIILMPGDAFEIDFGHNYDVVLVPNFFHHFNEATNVEMMKKIAAALKPNGQIIIVEFVPNEDRVSPPLAARFAFTMLTTTAEGDAYTLSAFTRMLDAAGFKVDESRPLLPTPLTAISARKR